MVVGLEDRNQVELLILEPTLDRWRNGRIDNDPTQIGSDPRAAWATAVANHQTILGFEDWLLKVSVEHVQHRQNRAAA